MKLLLTLLLAAAPLLFAQQPTDWKVGLAAIDITPETPVPMAGYASRRQPFEEPVEICDRARLELDGRDARSRPDDEGNGNARASLRGRDSRGDPLGDIPRITLSLRGQGLQACAVELIRKIRQAISDVHKTFGILQCLY